MILGAIVKVGCLVLPWLELIISFFAVMKIWGALLLEREKNRQAKKRKGS